MAMMMFPYMMIVFMVVMMICRMMVMFMVMIRHVVVFMVMMRRRPVIMSMIVRMVMFMAVCMLRYSFLFAANQNFRVAAGNAAAPDIFDQKIDIPDSERIDFIRKTFPLPCDLRKRRGQHITGDTHSTIYI
jgi:hypothetical protein